MPIRRAHVRISKKTGKVSNVRVTLAKPPKKYKKKS